MTVAAAKNGRLQAEEPAPLIITPTPDVDPNSLLLKLDLGCGQNKREGFQGVDKFACTGVDVVHDLMTFPWPFEDNSVGEVHSSHFFEHVPQYQRYPFMDELWRVMAPKAKALIITPWARSARATQDPSHCWPPISEESYFYFNKAWREANKLTHGFYESVCDFDFQWGHQWRPEWVTRSEQARQFAHAHYWNVIDDLHVTLTVRK